ncbi:polyphosphate kinase 1 [Halorientalis sp.]|uniref:polyphosphate kinase 1 n=1 Tax=Halorientalis sp. TaxID=1931229 RepID=UPI00260C445D|nr:polyphosphate kinase 1 [Halorientalis sp.]
MTERYSESAPATVDEIADLTDPKYYLNRELSQLEFQKRVLNEALDERTPLLERVRFLGLFTKNMDEFVMKRVGGLKQQIEAGVTEQSVDGRTPHEQWVAVLETMQGMFDDQMACYRDEIKPALAEAGIDIESWEDLSAADRTDLREYFEESVFPILTPLSFDPAHPFPFISNLSLSLGVFVTREDRETDVFTRIKIPPNQPRLIEIEAGSRYILIEELIRSNLDLLLPDVEVQETALFRPTRNAEVRRDEEVAEDLIEMIEDVIEQRRFASVVRLEVEAGMSEQMRDLLTRQLDLDEREVFEHDGPLGFREFMPLTDLDRPDLSLSPWTPLPHPRFAGDEWKGDSLSDGLDIFEAIQERDILLHHPYHSFTGTVQEFLDRAATDPDVRAIKAAIYRTASDSKVIQSLIDAAENGKQVAVMVELKARFDEENNLEWVRKLEEEGIHVAYGTRGLKTHTKTALVVRAEDDGMQLYSHVATGNYHSETAKGYVDLGLLTANRDIGRDLAKLFNFYTGPSIDEEFSELLIAPVTMRDEFTRMIRREADHARAGRRARIVAKVNALEDPKIVEELYRASIAGVDIDLIVRDICRLRPGLEDVSETVSVYSVVGRFLEHSRIFYFENGGEPEYYTGSADWMTRNLDNRVEAVTPIEDVEIRRQLRYILEIMLADNRKCWEMQSDGTYVQRRPDADEPERNTQQLLMQNTLEELHADDDLGVETTASPPTETELLVAPTEERADVAEAERPDAESTPNGGQPVESGSAGHSAGAVRDTGPGADDDLPEAMDRHRDRWYVPDSDTYSFAVRTPDGGRAYRKTADSAAALVAEYYENDS